MSYQLACPCGRSLSGQRLRRHQVIACPGCGRKHFIFPEGPWTAGGAASAPAAGAPVSHIRLGRLLLVIVLGGVAAIGLLLLLVRPYLRRQPPELPTAEDVRARIDAGERRLREGDFHLALKELDEAARRREQNPALLDRDEVFRLTQLRRQSDLLARLLDRSLEEILQQAVHHRNDEEWREKVKDYLGRTVAFDDVLRRDAAERPVLGLYTVRAGELEARVALEDLTLLRQLPLDPPQRWLFGARLADCRREEGGVWTFHFEPDSAVLLTDEDAAAACGAGPPDDELRAVLKRQDEWLRR